MNEVLVSTVLTDPLIMTLVSLQNMLLINEINRLFNVCYVMRLFIRFCWKSI